MCGLRWVGGGEVEQTSPPKKQGGQKGGCDKNDTEMNQTWWVFKVQQIKVICLSKTWIFAGKDADGKKCHKNILLNGGCSW